MKIINFQNLNAYITGGSSGIGLETAKALAGLGANIIIFARSREKLKKAAEGISASRGAFSGRVEYSSLDVADNQTVLKEMNSAVKTFGAPDILINCAGRAYPKKFEDVGYAQFDETMKINLYGIWNTISALYPHMKSRGGCIVNTSSIAGFLGVYGYSDYTASKFAVMGLSDSLRDEFQFDNISVLTLCPPDTQTPGFDTENKTKPAETLAISANAKVMRADAVAKALIKGIQKGTKVIIPGFDGKMTYCMNRIFPSIVRMIINSSIRRARK